MNGRRKPMLALIKTPLHPTSEAHMKELQLALADARQEINDARPPSKRESRKMTGLFNLAGFTKVMLRDGTLACARFAAGLRHPETGLDYYVVVSRKAAEDFLASPWADYNWRADADEDGYISVKLLRSADTKSAARVMYEMDHPNAALTKRCQVTVKQNKRGERNALDLRPGNLEVQPASASGGGRSLSRKVDLTPFEDRIAAVKASIDSADA